MRAWWGAPLFATILASLLALLVAPAPSFAQAAPTATPTPIPLPQTGRSMVSGIIYYDANSNDRPDAGERVIVGFEVKIEQDNAELTAKTNDKGFYEFKDLPAGIYIVTPLSPQGFGVSGTQPDREVVLDGRNAKRDVSFGIVRGGLTRTPTPTPSPIATATRQPSGTPLPAPTSIPIVTPLPENPPPQPDSSAAPAPGPRSGGPSAGRPGGPSLGPGSRDAAPTATPVPPAAQPAAPSPTRTPTVEPTATPTRTPSALDGQRAAAERARAALGSPSDPRTGSMKGENAVMLDVDFRTAVDGSEYEDTNSGVAGLAMALDAYGFSVPTADLRNLANELDRSYDVSQAPRLELLVRLGEMTGLKGVGLYQGTRAAVWSTDEVRERLRAGYPVLTLIRPAGADGPGELGRERYVLLIGYEGPDLLYHDPAFPDMAGAKRRISNEGLIEAWAAGPAPARAAALALGRVELGLFAPPADLKAAARNPDAALGLTPVPVPTTQVASAPLGETTLKPVIVETPPLSKGPAPESGPFGLPPLHPLLLAFVGVALLVGVKVVAGLVFD